MKQILAWLLLTAFTSPTRGQGTLSFVSVGAEITFFSPYTPTPPSSHFAVSIYLASDTAFANPLATTGFIEGTGLINPPDSLVIVPGYPVNSTATFVIRAFEAGNSWEQSSWQGISAAFTAGPLGGPNPLSPPTPPPTLDNLQPFSISQIPEPKDVLLASMGFMALLVSRTVNRRLQNR